MPSTAGVLVRAGWALAVALVAVGCEASNDLGPDGAADGHPAPDGGGVDGGPDASTDRRCTWGVDALLEEVGASAPERHDCGTFNGADTEAVVTAFDCFEQALDASASAELTLNRCIDCAIPTTYVVTGSGDRYAILMEDDAYGDGVRTAIVERCSSITLDRSSPELVLCDTPTELYHCEESRDLPLSAR